MILIAFFSALFIITQVSAEQPKERHQKRAVEKEFPKDFSFGASTAAYQVEGAVREDGKGENIWDRFIHTDPNRIMGRANADIACDSYHKYKEDVQMLKAIGFHHYRFSISWTRVLPQGHENFINKKGLDYYHRLIDELLANGIQPLVILYHWDLPQPLQDLGGWANPVMAQYFARFARIVFKEFGHKVKWWTTINEPLQISYLGYGKSIFAPGVNQTGIADYLASHNLLLAHARVYHMYKRDFAPTQKGKVGISIHSIYFEPKTNSAADIEAAEKATQFMTGLYAHPIFSKKGDYADLVKEVVGKLSKKEGWVTSRLPRLSRNEIEFIRGSYDFFGLNHYTSKLTGACEKPPCEDFFMLNPEADVMLTANPFWAKSASAWLQSYPAGVRKLLNWIKREYDNPPVLITEAGWSTPPSDNDLADQPRIEYFQGYLEHVLAALVEDKCNVIGFTAWALMDNFEWVAGYTQRFGLYHVDFNNPKRPRTKRKSADFFKKVIETRKIPNIHTSNYSGEPKHIHQPS